MAVDGVNSNAQKQEAASTRKQREAKERELELVKKHQSELARLSRQHRAELKVLQDQYGQSTDNLKRNTQETLTQKDQEYQKDIDEMRDLHRQNMRRTVLE